jgi:hypothetical protein
VDPLIKSDPHGIPTEVHDDVKLEEFLHLELAPFGMDRHGS